MTAPPRLAARVVWAGWALLSAASLFLVASCARNVPYWDDWKLVPVLLRLQPPSLAWIWEQCNEHRLPLSKALMLMLARLSGDDLRWAMVASALLLCALPALMLHTLRRLAGALSWTDLVLPVALLHWGHQFNLLFQMQLHFVLAVVLFVGVLMVLLRLVEPEPSAAGASAGQQRTWPLFALALPLPWVSGLGLCLAPPLVVWMLWAAERVPRTALRLSLRLCAALLAMGVTVLLFDLPSSPASGAGFVGLADTLATAQRCLSTALGPVGRELWPWSGLCVALLGACTVLLLARVMLREPERLGAAVLLAGLLALGGLALVIGASRARLGWEAGFAPRYVTVMAPGLCCAHLAWRLHGQGLGRRAVPALLCVTLLVALPFNTWLGLRDAREHAADLGALEADVRAGVPNVDVARTHWSRICPSEVVLGEDLEMLRQSRHWIFQPDD